MIKAAILLSSGVCIANAAIPESLDAKCKAFCEKSECVEYFPINELGREKCILKRAGTDGAADAYFVVELTEAKHSAKKVYQNSYCEARCNDLKAFGCNATACTAETGGHCIGIKLYAPGMICHGSNAECQNKEVLPCEAPVVEAAAAPVAQPFNFYPQNFYPGAQAPFFFDGHKKKHKKHRHSASTFDPTYMKVKYHGKKGLMFPDVKYDKKHGVFVKSKGRTVFMKGGKRRKGGHYTFNKIKNLKGDVSLSSDNTALGNHLNKGIQYTLANHGDHFAKHGEKRRYLDQDGNSYEQTNIRITKLPKKFNPRHAHKDKDLGGRIYYNMKNTNYDPVKNEFVKDKGNTYKLYGAITRHKKHRYAAHEVEHAHAKDWLAENEQAVKALKRKHIRSITKSFGGRRMWNTAFDHDPKDVVKKNNVHAEWMKTAAKRRAATQ